MTILEKSISDKSEFELSIIDNNHDNQDVEWVDIE